MTCSSLWAIEAPAATDNGLVNVRPCVPRDSTPPDRRVRQLFQRRKRARTSGDLRTGANIAKLNCCTAVFDVFLCIRTCMRAMRRQRMLTTTMDVLNRHYQPRYGNISRRPTGYIEGHGNRLTDSVAVLLDKWRPSLSRASATHNATH